MNKKIVALRTTANELINNTLLSKETNSYEIEKQKLYEFKKNIRRQLLTLNTKSDDYQKIRLELENIIKAVSANIVLPKIKEDINYDNIKMIDKYNDDDCFSLLDKLGLKLPDNIILTCYEKIDSWCDKYNILKIEDCKYSIATDSLSYGEIHIVKMNLFKNIRIRDKTNIIIKENNQPTYLCNNKIQIHLLCKINNNQHKIIYETSKLDNDTHDSIDARCITVAKFK